MPVKLSAEVFQELVDSGKLDFKRNTMSVAHAVLVRGLGLAEAAKEVGITKQAASQAVKRVLKCIEAVPPDWVKVWVPPQALAEVQAVVQKHVEKKAL